MAPIKVPNAFPKMTPQKGANWHLFSEGANLAPSEKGAIWHLLAHHHWHLLLEMFQLLCI